MDTPQSKAFWLGHNLYITWVSQASGGNPQDDNLIALRKTVDGFAKALDLDIQIPAPGDIQRSLATLREGIRMDLAISRTEFVAQCYLFGLDFTAWAGVRGGYDDPPRTDTDFAKVETNLMAEAAAVGLTEELEQCFAAARNKAMTKQQFNEFAGIDMLLKMSARLNAGAGASPASNRLFIVMPMNPDDDRLPEVLDAIQQAGKAVSLDAFRVDQLASAGRITDDIVGSLKAARFVVVDLTNSRPNVYWEAGFAHGLGKLPIYIARAGTDPAFDIKDYPVISFKNTVELREKLIARLRGVMAKAAGA